MFLLQQQLSTITTTIFTTIHYFLGCINSETVPSAILLDGHCLIIKHYKKSTLLAFYNSRGMTRHPSVCYFGCQASRLRRAEQHTASSWWQTPLMQTLCWPSRRSAIRAWNARSAILPPPGWLDQARTTVIMGLSSCNLLSLAWLPWTVYLGVGGWGGGCCRCSQKQLLPEQLLSLRLYLLVSRG